MIEKSSRGTEPCQTVIMVDKQLFLRFLPPAKPRPQNNSTTFTKWTFILHSHFNSSYRSLYFALNADFLMPSYVMFMQKYHLQYNQSYNFNSQCVS